MLNCKECDFYLQKFKGPCPDPSNYCGQESDCNYYGWCDKYDEDVCGYSLRDCVTITSCGECKNFELYEDGPHDEYEGYCTVDGMRRHDGAGAGCEDFEEKENI